MSGNTRLSDNGIFAGLTRMISFVLAFVIAFGLVSGNLSLAENASVPGFPNVDMMASDVCGYVNVDAGNNLNIRKGPGTTYEIIKSLPAGTIVRIVGEVTESGRKWYYIGYATENAQAYGFCSAEYIGFVSPLDDPEFEAVLEEQGFPESYRVYLRVVHHFHPTWIFELMDPGVSWDEDLYEQTQYKESFITLTSISSWKSTRSDNYNWDSDSYVVFEGNKTNASEALVAYYIDPRNFLNDVQIFQFEKQTYSESLNNEDVINKILYGTFMYEAYIPGGDTRELQRRLEEEARKAAEATPVPTAAPTEAPTEVPTEVPTEAPAEIPGELPTEASEGTTAPSAEPLTTETPALPTETPVPPTATPVSPTATPVRPTATPAPATPTPVPVGDPVTYAEAFIRFGQEFNVSPLMLAARVRQEQGVYGTSQLISGTVKGHEGYYNYFNIGASGNTPAIILENGMKEAESEGWTSHYLALEGGARKVAQNYISKGQDTIYLQKFDLDGEYYDRFWHQYMQNIQAPTYETRNTLNTYKSYGLDTADLVFKIPILKDMPPVAAICPTVDGNPNYRLKSITVDGVPVEDFKSGTYYYFIKTGVSASAVNIQAKAVNSKTKIVGTGQKELEIGENKLTIETVAENGDVGQYTLIITRLKVDITPEPTPSATPFVPTPTATPAPTKAPTQPPTQAPTQVPTQEPTQAPTEAPTQAPSTASTDSPLPTVTPTPTTAPTPTPVASYDTSLSRSYNAGIDKDVLYGIEPGTTVADVKSKFTLQNARIVFKNRSGTELSDKDKVGTGTSVRIYSTIDDKILNAMSIVIFGDVNGDGSIDEFDFVFIKRDVWEIKPLEGVDMVAGAISAKDPAKSSDVNEFDFVHIKRHVWGIAPISQSR